MAYIIPARDYDMGKCPRCKRQVKDDGRISVDMDHAQILVTRKCACDEVWYETFELALHHVTVENN